MKLRTLTGLTLLAMMLVALGKLVIVGLGGPESPRVWREAPKAPDARMAEGPSPEFVRVDHSLSTWTETGWGARQGVELRVDPHGALPEYGWADGDPIAMTLVGRIDYSLEPDGFPHLFLTTGDDADYHCLGPSAGYRIHISLPEKQNRERGLEVRVSQLSSGFWGSPREETPAQGIAGRVLLTNSDWAGSEPIGCEFALAFTVDGDRKFVRGHYAIY